MNQERDGTVDMAKTAPTHEISYATARGWLDAWRAARVQGFDTVTLTADDRVLATLMMNHKTGALTRLLWHRQSGRWEDVLQPSWAGVGETVTAEYRIMRECPDLGWQLPRRPSVRGKGIFRYPLGPVRADVAESLLYRLAVMGDEIVSLTLQNGYKERHIRHLICE